MIDGCLRLAATTLGLASAMELISQPGVSGSIVAKEGDMLLVRDGLPGALIRMRVGAVLGSMGDVGGEGSTEGVMLSGVLR